MKNWPELMSIKKIKVFINFANFYWRFIQSFKKIALLLISMLKKTRLLKKLINIDGEKCYEIMRNK